MSYAQSILGPNALVTRPGGEVVYLRDIDPTTAAVYGAIGIASIGLSAYHGVKRNNGSIGYGCLWGLAGAVFPIITPAIAFAQGYAEPAK